MLVFRPFPTQCLLLFSKAATLIVQPLKEIAMTDMAHMWYTKKSGKMLSDFSPSPS